MTFAKLCGVYGLTLGAFLLLDGLWLGVVARGVYRRELAHLLAPEIRWGAAVVFYFLYVAGILALVVLPHRDASLVRTVALGGVLGLCAYAAYDLTNLATIARWPVAVTVVDLVWGTVLTAGTAVAGRLAARWLL
ncbi:MAG: DUF2177 family protein [Acidobacteriota bacterium]